MLANVAATPGSKADLAGVASILVVVVHTGNRRLNAGVVAVISRLVVEEVTTGDGGGEHRRIIRTAGGEDTARGEVGTGVGAIVDSLQHRIGVKHERGVVPGSGRLRRIAGEPRGAAWRGVELGQLIRAIGNILRGVSIEPGDAVDDFNRRGQFQDAVIIRIVVGIEDRHE